MVRINNENNFMRKESVELIPGKIVTINSLPYDFHQVMMEKLPSPVAPLRAVKDEHGQPIYRDKKSKRVETVHDDGDPEYKRRVAAVTLRQTAYLVYHGTVNGGSFQWEANPDGMSVNEFCDAINAELREAGVGQGYILRLIKAIMDISGFGDEQIEAAQASFLSAETCET